MEIIHDLPEYEYSLKIDYLPLLGKWAHSFKSILESQYMSELMLFLNEEIKKKTVYPVRNNIFKAFKLTQSKDLRVVVLNCDPDLNHRSNGVAFGNIDSIGGDFDPSLIHLMQNIEHYEYDGMLLNVDYTLENWANQGMLLLNKHLSSGYRKNHEQWEKFTKFVIKYISDNFNGIIFVLIGDKKNDYSNLINAELHPVLFSEKLDYNILKRINNEIEYINGKADRFKW